MYRCGHRCIRANLYRRIFFEPCCRHLRAVYAVDCSESLRVSVMCVHLDVRVYLLSLRVRSNFFSCPPESESPFFEWLQAATSTPHVAAILCRWRITCEVRFPLHNAEHEYSYARRSSFIPMHQGSMGMRTTGRIYPEMFTWQQKPMLPSLNV